MAQYLTLNSGGIKTLQSTITFSSGVSDSDRLVSTASNGRFDPTVIAEGTPDPGDIIRVNASGNLEYVDLLQNLSILRLRRTTNLTLPTTWVDFDWDTTDDLNNSAILDYTGTPADTITIGETGTYLVSWAISAEEEVDVRLLNNGVVVPGSFHTVGDKDDEIDGQIFGNSKTIALTLNAGTLVLQVQANTGFEFTVGDSSSISLVRLTGAKGNDGAQGSDGAQGETGFGIYAWADVTGAGVLNDGIGVTVVRTGVGTYDYTFTTPLGSAAYAVKPQIYDVVGNTDTNTFVNNRTASGFTLLIGQGDNGTDPDILMDEDHSVLIVGGTSGIPAQTTVISVQNDGTNLGGQFTTINFDSGLTAVDSGGGVATVTASGGSGAVYSIVKVPSTAADLAANYNINGTEVPVILSGTPIFLGDGATDFTNNLGSVTCNFNGAVEVSFSLPHESQSPRASLQSTIQINGVNEGSSQHSYIRDSTGHERDTNGDSDVFTVSFGDVIRIGNRRTIGSNQGGAINLLERCKIIIKRLA